MGRGTDKWQDRPVVGMERCRGRGVPVLCGEPPAGTETAGTSPESEPRS